MLWRYSVNHVHIYLPHPKYSQAFGSAERNLGPNHELIPKHQACRLGHEGTTHDVNIFV